LDKSVTFYCVIRLGNCHLTFTLMPSFAMAWEYSADFCIKP
jgi:hypothetical protein